MTPTEFDATCGRLPGAEMVIQWGGSHVWKIGGKLFAIAGGQPRANYVFKTTALSFEILLAQGIAVRAPYLPRGNWVRVDDSAAMSANELGDHLSRSYELVAATLTKTVRRAVGLAP